MDTKDIEPFVKNDHHRIDFIMCSVINERNNFNPDGYSGNFDSTPSKIKII